MKIKQLLKEMIPVILGILVALFINNWNENRKDSQFLDKMMSSIGEELEENKEELIIKVAEHQQLIDTIELYQDEDVSIGEYIGRAKGLRVASIKNTAWQAIVNSRIDLLDYSMISTLTNIDQQKDNMSSKLDKLMDLLYERAGSSNYIDIELFKMTVNDLLHTEMRLLELHREFLTSERINK